MTKNNEKSKYERGQSSSETARSSSRLKIFYLMNTPMPNRRSSTLQVMYTCNGLANHGNFVKLFVTSEGASKSTIGGLFEFYGMKKNFKIQRLPTVNYTWRTRTWSFVLLTVPYVLVNMLRYGKPDLIYIRGVAVAWPFLVANRLLGIRVFYETQELGSEVASKIHELVAIEEKKSKSSLRRLTLAEQFIFRNAYGIVVGTEKLKQAIINLGLSGNKIGVIPDGFDPERFRIPRNIKKNKIDSKLVQENDLIGYIGHLYYWKGVGCLVEAMAVVVKDFPGARLLIVGGLQDEPDIKRLKKLVDRKGISKNVIFTGYVQPDRVPYYLALPRILVIPTLDTIMGKYAMPMKIFEYMAAGKAIIATDLDAHRQILEHEKTALLVHAGDPESMGSAIIKLLKAKSLARYLGRNAEKRAYKDFTWERRAERIENFLKERMIKDVM